MNVYPALFLFENDKKLKHSCKRRKKEDIMQFIDKFLKTIPADGSGELTIVTRVYLGNHRKLCALFPALSCSLIFHSTAPAEVAPEPEELPEKKLKGIQGAVWQLDKEDMLMLLENKKKDFLFVLYYFGYVHARYLSMSFTNCRL